MDDYINRLENNDSTLVKLDLWNRKIIDTKRFVNSLKNNTYLRCLEIRYGGYYFSADEIVEILKYNTSLQKIIIYGMKNISEGNFNKIINTLKINISLRILDIGYGHINDDNAGEIANMLKVNTTLQKIYIYNNKINENGLIEIINALRINTTLKVLDIEHNKFREKDVKEEIIDILQYNYTLKKLIGVDLGDFLSPENRNLRRRFLTTKCAKKS